MKTSRRRKQAVLAFVVACALAGASSSAMADAYADYERGVNAAFDGDYATAFREFSVAADEGLMLAQYNLGILYFTGRGVERDSAQAYRWTLAAAEQGHTAAQFNLASLLSTGDGVAKDPQEGAQWYARAAKAGHPQAALTLAAVYAEGDGVARDRVMAHAWASYAVLNSAEGAEELRGEIEAELAVGELSTARRLFARWQIEN